MIDLQQSASVDNAIDGERVFAPAYGPKEDILIIFIHRTMVEIQKE